MKDTGCYSCALHSQCFLDMTKVGSHIRYSKVPAEFLWIFQTNRSIRGSGRLYFAIRLLLGSIYHPDNAEETALLLKYFKKEQLRPMLKKLIQHGFLRLRRDGSIFISSTKNFVDPVYSKKGIEIKTNHVVVPEQAIENKEVWSEYLACIAWSDLAVGYATSRKMKKKSKCYSVQHNPTGAVAHRGKIISAINLLTQGTDSVLMQGVSNSSYAKRAGVHKSTASRARKRGAKFGYFETARWFYYLGVKMTLADRPFVREYGLDIDPNRLVEISGQLWEEAPTQVILHFNPFVKA